MENNVKDCGKLERKKRNGVEIKQLVCDEESITMGSSLIQSHLKLRKTSEMSNIS